MLLDLRSLVEQSSTTTATVAGYRLYRLLAHEDQDDQWRIPLPASAGGAAPATRPNHLTLLGVR